MYIDFLIVFLRRINTIWVRHIAPNRTDDYGYLRVLQT
jgi:hypothetical protein